MWQHVQRRFEDWAWSVVLDLGRVAVVTGLLVVLARVALGI